MEIAVGGGGGGEKLYSQNLRDFLRIEEDHRRNLNQSTSSSSSGGRRSSSGLTLSAILLSDKIGQPPPVEDQTADLRRVESNRTLLDIIREDQTAGLGRGREDGRRSWRQLKDKIRLRRRGDGPLAVPTPSSDADTNRHQTAAAATNADSGESSTQSELRAPIPLRNPRRSTESASGRFEQPNSQQATIENRTEETGSLAVEAAADGGGSPEQPVRMSLMALLAENDRQNGYESSAYVMDEVDTEEEETGTSTAAADDAGGGSKGAEYENCCVCMVRHKGAAFIPCGHTFCRLCSRELWVQRGNCPLCNNFILEILDIF